MTARFERRTVKWQYRGDPVTGLVPNEASYLVPVRHEDRKEANRRNKEADDREAVEAYNAACAAGSALVLESSVEVAE